MPLQIVTALDPDPQTKLPAGQVVVYAVGTGYAFDHGLVALPVAGPARSPSKVLRLHGGICYKVVRYVGSRLLARPEPLLPHWETNSDNEVLMYRHFEMNEAGTLLDGQNHWTMKGEYRYVLLTPPGDNDALQGACPPWSDLTTALTRFYLSNLARNVIAPVPPVEGAQGLAPKLI